MGDRGHLINIEAFKNKFLNLLFSLISSNPKLFTKGDLLGPWNGVWSLARILRKNWVKSTCPIKRFCQPFLPSKEGIDSISDCYCCCCCCWWWQLWVRWKEMGFFLIVVKITGTILTIFSCIVGCHGVHSHCHATLIIIHLPTFSPS